MLFHGTNINNQDGILLPHKSFDFESYVYATDLYWYSIIRCGRFRYTESMFKEDWGENTYTLIELQPRAFEIVFNTDGYIHYINNSDFVNIRYGEWVSTSSVDIKHTAYIHDVANEINKGIKSGIYTLIRYNEWGNYWKSVHGGYDGYMQRRNERLELLKT